ncbi:MAG: CPBP family intramembrane glutamic endopeptidase [Dehalococcoidia bacterium]
MGGGPGARAAAPSLPRQWASRRLSLATALVTLAAFAAAELVATFVDPIAGVALHGLILSAVLLASGVGGGDLARDQGPLGRLMYSLALVPLIRIVSLAMPLARFDEPLWFVAAAVPVAVAGVVVMAALGLRPREIGVRLSRRGLPLQLGVVVFGLALGFCEYHILRPEPLIGELTLARFIGPALVLMFATGFFEEFIFRGILQRTAAQALGGPLALVYVSLIFAILHIGYASATDFAFVFAIALLYGWVVMRTGSIISVSVSHGITNITLFLLMPYIPVLSASLGPPPL